MFIVNNQRTYYITYLTPMEFLKVDGCCQKRDRYPDLSPTYDPLLKASEFLNKLRLQGDRNFRNMALTGLSPQAKDIDPAELIQLNKLKTQGD
jgi:hypothetical protein